MLIAPLFNVHSDMGTLFGLKAFAVAILGGITSAWGVMAAGLLFGIVEAMVTSTLGSGYTQIITFALVIATLALRPDGLFGRASVKQGMTASRRPLRIRTCAWRRAGVARTRYAGAGRNVLLAVAACVYAATQVNGYYVFVLANVALMAIVGIGLNVLIGFTGQISFGHVGFYAIGAYAVAILTTKAALPFWLAWPMAMLLAGVASAIWSRSRHCASRAPIWRWSRSPSASSSNTASIELRTLTGGQNGLMNLPRPRALRIRRQRTHASRFVAIVVRRLCAGCFPLALARRVGRGDARGPRQRCRGGIDRHRSGDASRPSRSPVCGARRLAGGLFAPLSGFVTPSSFSFLQSILFVLVVMIGGAGSFAGPVVGAIIVGVLPEAAREPRGVSAAVLRRVVAHRALGRA